MHSSRSCILICRLQFSIQYMYIAISIHYYYIILNLFFYFFLHYLSVTYFFFCLCYMYKWPCKVCDELLKHFHYGFNCRYPCTYTDCPCTFKSWKNLLSHTNTQEVSNSTCSVNHILLADVWM